MNDVKFMYTCDLCGAEYQFGRHIYDGKYIPRYKLNVCMNCYSGNHDGWSPHDERIILKHIEENGLSVPERNEEGLLPRD